jgi:hypothetical protein
LRGEGQYGRNQALLPSVVWAAPYLNGTLCSTTTTTTTTTTTAPYLNGTRGAPTAFAGIPTCCGASVFGFERRRGLNPGRSQRQADLLTTGPCGFQCSFCFCCLCYPLFNNNNNNYNNNNDSHNYIKCPCKSETEWQTQKACCNSRWVAGVYMCCSQGDTIRPIRCKCTTLQTAPAQCLSTDLGTESLPTGQKMQAPQIPQTQERIS